MLTAGEREKRQSIVDACRRMNAVGLVAVAGGDTIRCAP
jgi:hypothetical protein